MKRSGVSVRDGRAASWGTLSNRQPSPVGRLGGCTRLLVQSWIEELVLVQHDAPD